MAAQNLWLTAHSEGLAACWLCAPLFVPDLVRQTLELPVDWEPLGLMTLGYPAELKEKSRAPLAEKVIWRSRTRCAVSGLKEHFYENWRDESSRARSD
jgi:nitroreductase